MNRDLAASTLLPVKPQQSSDHIAHCSLFAADRIAAILQAMQPGASSH
jgi:hypothetical protein